MTLIYELPDLIRIEVLPMKQLDERMHAQQFDLCIINWKGMAYKLYSLIFNEFII